jgi:hypothetical protein
MWMKSTRLLAMVIGLIVGMGITTRSNTIMVMDSTSKKPIIVERVTNKAVCGTHERSIPLYPSTYSAECPILCLAIPAK